MQQTLFDRAISYVAPVYAARRTHARAQLATFGALAGGDSSGSGGGVVSRVRRFMGMGIGRDAQADLMPTLGLDRAESRMLARTSPIAGGAINTNVDRVVGTGLALSVTPNQAVLGWSDAQALEWKTKVQAEFALWADGVACDYTETENFYGLQALILRSTLESGDTFTLMPDGKRSALMPYALRLQVLEADRVGNPTGQMDTREISGGIKTDSNGKPLAAHVYNRHPGAAFVAGDGNPFAGVWQDFTGTTGRRRLLQHFRRLRPGQLRGMPYLAPIVDSLKQLTKYTEAELAAAVVSAMFTVFIKSPTGTVAPVFTGSEAEQKHAEDTGDVRMGNGAIVGLAPGEEATFADPTRPNPNAEAFVAGVMTQVGMALGIPRELLLKQFNASYSASKAALLDAWVYFRGVRNWLALSFCQPAYETWLAEAVAIGRIPAPGFFTDPLRRWAYTRAEWRGDSMGSINPKDEVAAATAAIDARLTTRERATWELYGSDWDAQLPRMADEHKRLDAAGILPVPKAGAPAPAPTTETTTAAA